MNCNEIDGSLQQQLKTHMSDPKTLCLLRLSAIGDVCHAAAMVERIQRNRPNIEITWIIGKVEYQLLKGMPGIRFVVFDKSQGKAAYKALKETLKSEVFDVLFVMQVALRANWAAHQIQARKKVGFDWQRSKELHWWFVNQRITKQTHPHVLDGFMAFAQTLGIEDTTPARWSIPIDAADQQWANEQAQAWQSFAVISPAASKAERNWLPERYAQVADHLHKLGLKVILCGGPGPLDKQLGEEIERHSRHVHANMIGQTSLKQMLALLGNARLVVAPDTGPAHMATAAGVPVVGLYAHSNPLRTGPYNSLDYVASVYNVVIEQQQGKPWQTLPWGVRAKGKNLMSRISVEMVTAQIDRLIQA
jgi:heptosyltransferase I